MMSANRTAMAYAFVIMVLFYVAPEGAGAAGVAGDGFVIDLAPRQYEANVPVRMRALRDEERCIGIYANDIAIDHVQRIVDVSLTVQQWREDVPCQSEIAHEVMIGILQNAGTYRVNYYVEKRGHRVEYFQAENYLDTDFITSIGLEVPHVAETPRQGSIQSGVGLIRGWACYADRIEIRFNDEPRRAVAYGTARADTVPVCGDDENGYGMVFAWGALGAGEHRMRTYIDGVEIADVTFTVAMLDSSFERGLSGNYVLEGFTRAGESVEIQWSEAAQNFVIVRHTTEEQ